MSEHGHATNWRQWLGHLAGKHALGIELGTWKGESAEWMLDNIFTSIASLYTCVDTFKGSAEHHARGIDCNSLEAETRARLARFGTRCIITRRESHVALRAMRTPVDFIYVDADHSSMGTLRDGVLGWDLLKVGGIMIFDDYRWKDMPDELDRPALAVDAFCQCFARQIEVLSPVGWQVAIRKV